MAMRTRYSLVSLSFVVAILTLPTVLGFSAGGVSNVKAGWSSLSKSPAFSFKSPKTLSRQLSGAPKVTSGDAGFRRRISLYSSDVQQMNSSVEEPSEAEWAQILEVRKNRERGVTRASRTVHCVLFVVQPAPLFNTARHFSRN